VSELDYVIRVLASPTDVDAQAWNALLATQAGATPFMRHEYLVALHQSAAATPQTGWTPRFITLWRGDDLVGACPLYLKAHSYGEYVFDWAWANAYQQHGLSYYPKALVAVPFTPVPGARLLAKTAADRVTLVQGLVQWCGQEKLSSLHLLFANDDDIAACSSAGLMLRHTVQFHWKNIAPTLVASRTALPPKGEHFVLGRPCDETGPFRDFDEFLTTLSQEKRKKIRQERRKVADAGVTFRHAQGTAISTQDWDFFYRCYERTYLEHGNAPYLSRDFFQRLADTQSQNWLLFVAMQNGDPIATSLIAIYSTPTGTSDHFYAKSCSEGPTHHIAYGRYWGALKRVDCLHFEACYYQPLQWCIEHGFDRFEGGAQGEHKMARALMPVKTTSAHWLAHPSFADAIERFLEREGHGIEAYMGDLSQRSPFRHPAT
jgi:predicted N-acyltransferase